MTNTSDFKDMEKIIVLDFGSQYNQLITRRIREFGVFSELMSHKITVEEIKEIAPKGIIFSGGPNSVYDEESFSIDPEIYELGIPILGICRGNQIINVKNGGNLWQDLSYVQKPLLKHWQEHHPDWATHSVDLEKGSLLHRIFETDTLMVNSFHHQIIKEVAPGFKVAARAKDGVIEAIEHESYPFMIGVQWHPEMLHQSVPIMNRLFQALIQATAHEMTDINLDQAVKVS